MTGRRSRWLLRTAAAALVALTCGLPVAADSHPPPRASTPHVTATLLGEAGTIAAGEPFWLAVRFEIAPGWHTYWRNPGDSGLPTRVDWTLPAGFTADPIEWAVPSRLPFGPLVNYGYSDEVVHLVRVTPPASLAPDETLTLVGDVSWLACADVCIPESATVGLRLATAADTRPDPDQRAAFATARARLPDPRGPAATLVDRGEVLELELDLDLPSSNVSAYFFPFENGVVDHAAAQRIEPTAAGARLLMRRGAIAPERLASFDGVLVLGDAAHASSGLALRPTVISGPALDPSVARSLTATEVPRPDPGTRPRMAPSLALLFAFLGGVILNLMPCVLPVIFIKGLGLLRSAAAGGGAVRAHGLVYTAGVLVTFGLLGGALVALRAAGSEIGWGFQLQSPAIVGLLALLMFAIGLNLAGALTIGTGTIAGAGQSLADRAGLAGSFFTGALAVVVATPCTAPFMAAALGFALTAPAPLALGVFLALGLGLASPYLLISLVPALVRLLPRPGAWMVRLKELLAFPMFATAAWLAWVIGAQAGPNGVGLLLAAMIALAFVAWLLRVRPRAGAPRLAANLLAGLTAIAAVGAVGTLAPDATASPGGAPGAERATSDTVWKPYSRAALDRLRADGRPVFLNMTADWCITCLVNERTALATDAVRDAMRARDVAYLKGDWTNRDPEISALLASFDRSGVPLYVLYPPTSSGREPVVLPQILTESTMLEALAAL
ncbi:MAG: thioredoxin family protein [Ectothiorhodospiraceae bacterium]|nr:thioredoxin family protein [Ectothiorhodospiraceae bacterium]